MLGIARYFFLLLRFLAKYMHSFVHRAVLDLNRFVDGLPHTRCEGCIFVDCLNLFEMLVDRGHASAVRRSLGEAGMLETAEVETLEVIPGGSSSACAL